MAFGLRSPIFRGPELSENLLGVARCGACESSSQWVVIWQHGGNGEDTEE
jgi:hypothetical protein